VICPDCKHDNFSHDAERCIHTSASGASGDVACSCSLSRGDVIDAQFRGPNANKNLYDAGQTPVRPRSML